MYMPDRAIFSVSTSVIFDGTLKPMQFLSKNSKQQWTKKFKILAFIMLAFSFTSYVALITNAQAAEDHTPVVLVHGYNNSITGCQGIDLSSYWKNVKLELTTHANIPADDVIPVSYYGCDKYGIDITGYGPGISYPFTATNLTVKPRAGHTSDASITRVAQDLAWFIHNEYTLKGRPVNVVGHSMGGLITREMLRRIQAGDPAFPSSIDVQKVLTISTPHNGWGSQCKSNTQCTEMSDGSQWLAELQTNPAPQGANGTNWWAMATAGVGEDAQYLTALCDVIPTDSAIAVGGTDLVYTKPCYKHNAYLNDKSQNLDAEGSAELGGRHSLAMMVEIMK
jgi:pimeloyl-ACP methyl ester carboxylesterase